MTDKFLRFQERPEDSVEALKLTAETAETIFARLREVLGVMPKHLTLGEVIEFRTVQGTQWLRKEDWIVFKDVGLRGIRIETYNSDEDFYKIYEEVRPVGNA